MNIGIDMDGVITDISRFIIDFGTKFRYENNINTEICENEYNEAKALGLTDEQSEKFWNEYLPYYASKYAVRDFAPEVIKKLREHGHKIIIITARNEDGLPKETYGTMKDMVKKWLNENQIEYDGLEFTVGSKLPYCIKNDIDVMIEDSPYNILDISTQIPILCFDNPYNKTLNGDNITRVYSWYEILYKIENNEF